MAGLAPQRMNDKQKRIRLQPLIFIGWRLGRRGCGERIFRLCCSALAGSREDGRLTPLHCSETLRSEGNRTQQQETTTLRERAQTEETGYLLFELLLFRLSLQFIIHTHHQG